MRQNLDLFNHIYYYLAAEKKDHLNFFADLIKEDEIERRPSNVYHSRELVVQNATKYELPSDENLKAVKYPLPSLPKEEAVILE